MLTLVGDRRYKVTWMVKGERSLSCEGYQALRDMNSWFLFLTLSSRVPLLRDTCIIAFNYTVRRRIVFLSGNCGSWMIASRRFKWYQRLLASRVSQDYKSAFMLKEANLYRELFSDTNFIEPWSGNAIHSFHVRICIQLRGEWYSFFRVAQLEH